MTTRDNRAGAKPQSVSRETGNRVAEMGTGAGWVALKSSHGRIQASYNPQLNLLYIRKRGEETLHNLSQYAAPHCQDSTDVLG